MKKSTEKTRNEAIFLYEQGNSAKEISRKLSFNEATVRKWLKNAGIELKKGGYFNKIYNEELVDKIETLYESGIYTTEIDKILNLKKGVSRYLLDKRNIKLRHRGPKSKIGKEDYFDIIDSEEKAYYLGFICADGNVSIKNNQYCLKFHIAYKDKEVIDNFLKAIKSKNKTLSKNYKGKESYYVSLSSIKMCKRLIELGIVPNKTGKEVIPNEVKEKYLRDFLRGYFDGDGITDVVKMRSGFVSGEKMINEILLILNEKFKVYYAGKNKKVKYFLGGKKFSKQLYNYLYEDAKTYLTRKKERLKYIAFNDGTPYEVKVSRTV